MTDQRELDRLMTAFFVEGTDELADRVIDAALDEIDHTQQRRRSPVPRRFQTMTMPIRLAAAAVIGALAVGGLWFYLQGSQPSVGGPPSTASPSSIPAAPTAWSPTEAITTDRVAATTTRLEDGRVLVAGGYVLQGDVQAQMATAELYDPATGTWSATGDMAYARRYFTATLLPNGKVLVAGGGGGGASAELYDPATGTWSAAHDMLEARGQHTAALLQDGRVLVAGGNEDDTTGTAELYDPASDTWTRTGDMTEWRASPGATVLSDGRVLVDGGYSSLSVGASAATSEIYDPATGAWTATGDMHFQPKDEQTTLRLPDGRVLVVGGTAATADVYDPATGAWTATRPLVHRHFDMLASSLLPDGSVLLVGGLGPPSTEPAPAERYDPATNAWTDAGSMTTAPYVRSATALSDGRVLVVGSSTGDGHGLGSTDVFDPGVSP
jgi:N-acetylneuraminic acid mutarotase